ncbi:MAG: ATP-binding cassette domain-containing protein [Patescibacteria group bacterium]
MLEIKNIAKNFGGVQAVKGSSFVVQKNKITALIGPNGAGKTTLFDIISGFCIPDSGSIVLNGESLDACRPDERASKGVSRTFQQVRLFKYLTIYDHLALSQGNDDTRLFHTLLKDLKIKRLSFRGGSALGGKDYETYEKLLKDFGIERPLNTVVSELSYGQRKLLEIMMAIHRPHALLLLDEPVAGVNAVVQERIERSLLRLKEQGETMLLIDHDMEFIRRISDHVIALDAGIVIAEGTPEEVLSDGRVVEAYLGE